MFIDQAFTKDNLNECLKELAKEFRRRKCLSLRERHTDKNAR